MIGRLLIAVAVILVALGGWLAIQAAVRRYAERHPELGPAREECAGGCAGHGCSGSDTTCKHGHHS